MWRWKRLSMKASIWDSARKSCTRRLRASCGSLPRRWKNEGDSMSDFAIQTRHLTKYFGAKRVVYDLNLNVPRGSIFGFLGRNGSGKTTTLRMVLGLLAPTWGNSMILGHDSQDLPA